MMRILTLLLLTALHYQVSAQKKFVKIFQASITPGLSTNGFHPGGYSNFFSMNITSGYSQANYLVEVGGISNLNVTETRGLQIAGVANLTGSNAFAGKQAAEIKKMQREGFEANLSGIQLSGVTNAVLNNVYGAQITGGVNVANNALFGLQLAGISNTVLDYSFGVQLAGLYNVSRESMDGLQLAGLFNITTGGLYGMQISLVNRAGFTEGINSFGNADPVGVQLGAVNYARSVNGFQIGLVNISGRMQGTQIGIINIFRSGKQPETRDGTSVGLINIGQSGYLSVYTNDLFTTSIEVATGAVKNRRVKSEIPEKQIQNGLIYSRNWGFLTDRSEWGFGYGLKKFWFNRTPTPGMSHLKFVSGGIDVMHINHENKTITRELSLLARPNMMAGTRFHPRNKVVFLFVGVAYNIYRSSSGYDFGPLWERKKENHQTGLQHWPGFTTGIFIQ